VSLALGCDIEGLPFGHGLDTYNREGLARGIRAAPLAIVSVMPATVILDV